MYYRVFPTEAIGSPLASVYVPYNTLEGVRRRESRDEFAVAYRDVKAGATVGQLRARFTNAIGIPDPNTVIIYMDRGLRPDALEGNSWELRSVVGWNSYTLRIARCHGSSYIVLHGHGKEYLY